jgi:hypothetical protein
MVLIQSDDSYTKVMPLFENSRLCIFYNALSCCTLVVVRGRIDGDVQGLDPGNVMVVSPTRTAAVCHSALLFVRMMYARTDRWQRIRLRRVAQALLLVDCPLAIRCP